MAHASRLGQHKVDIMLIYLHATNQHPRFNHQGEMNQQPKTGIFTLSHPYVAVFWWFFLKIFLKIFPTDFSKLFLLQIFPDDFFLKIFGPGGFVCATRGGVCNGHCYYQLSLSLSFFPFSSVFYFWPTSGKLPRLKICFPQYFGINRRYMQNWFFFCVFSSFRAQRSVTAAWATPSPWSIP